MAILALNPLYGSRGDGTKNLEGQISPYKASASGETIHLSR